MKPVVKDFFKGLGRDFLKSLAFAVGYPVAYFLLAFAIMFVSQYLGFEFGLILGSLLLPVLPLVVAFLIFKFIQSSFFRGLALIVVSLEVLLSTAIFGVTCGGSTLCNAPQSFWGMISNSISYVIVAVFFLAGLGYVLLSVWKFIKFSIGKK